MKKKPIKQVLRIVLIVFVSVVLGVNLYLWNAHSLTGNALPMPMGYGVAVVLTGSMEPAISADDVIIVAEKAPFDVGDVVVYQSGRMLVVHRIVAADEQTVTTKGDANNTPDEAVDRSLVKGKVITVIPGVGGVVKLLKTPVATVTLLAGAVVLMELSYRKEKKKGSDELERIKEEIRSLQQEMKDEE